MHEITFTPMRRDAPVAVSVAGDTLVIDGTAFELGGGAPCPWLAGLPEQSAGGWRLTLILPHGPDAPRETRFPEPVLMAGDGPVPMPSFSAPRDKEEADG